MSRISARLFLLCSSSGNAQFSYDGERVEQRRELEHQAELAAEVAEGLGRQREDVGAVDPDRAAVGSEQAHEVLDEHATCRRPTRR
jgi:hypothetical protein